MIIKKDGSIEMCSLYPNIDWYNEDNIVIDETTKNGKIFVQKIKNEYPDIEIIIKNKIVIDVISKPDPQKVFDKKMIKIRKRRDSLLKECDYTQILDYPITNELREKYKSYRQELRDLPSIITQCNIDSIQFPTKPE